MSQCLRGEKRLFEQRIHKFFRIERQQIARFFPNPHITHRESQFTRDGDHDSALGRAIELGQARCR